MSLSGLGFSQLSFSAARKSLAEQEFKANQFELPFRPLYQCDAITLFLKTAFSLGEAKGLVGLCHSSALQFPEHVAVVSQEKSLYRRLMKALCSLQPSNEHLCGSEEVHQEKYLASEW